MKRHFYLLVGLPLLTALLQGCIPAVIASLGTGVVLSQDRRSQDAFIEDQNLESTIARRLGKEFKGVMHVNVTSFNLNVLLTGEVGEEPTKAEIGEFAASFEKVRSVNNELLIASNSSLVSRSNDSLITSNVKVRFMNNKSFNPDHVKVVTEAGTVFLLGIVKRAEAEAAAEIASTTGGVKSVVKLFEYMD